MVLAYQTRFPNHANGQKIELAFNPGNDFMISGEAYQYMEAIIGIQYVFLLKYRLNYNLILQFNRYKSFLWLKIYPIKKYFNFFIILLFIILITIYIIFHNFFLFIYKNIVLFYCFINKN